MNQKISIRQGEIEDADALAKFNQYMALETEGIRLLPEVILSGVKKLIHDPNLGFYLVAEHQGRIVASLMITTEWSDWRNGLFWWVQSVYVETDYRRRGLYRQLYERIKDMAECDANVCGFRLYVEKDNVAAQQTYTQVGMFETDYKLFEEVRSGVQYREE